MAKPRTGRQIFLRLMFILYCITMAWLLFGQRADGTMTSPDNLNIVPLRTIKLYVNIIAETADAQLLKHAFVNLVGNVVMFIPLGLFLPSIWQKQRKIYCFLLTVFFVIITIELLQYATKLGSCDIDDLLLNFPGCLIGYCFQRAIVRPRR